MVAAEGNLPFPLLRNNIWWTIAMPKKRPKQAAKTLPTDPSLLTFLLERVQKVIDFFSADYATQTARVEYIRRGSADSESAIRGQPYMEAIKKVNIERHAKGEPSFDVLLPYVDPTAFANARQRLESSKDALRSAAKNPKDDFKFPGSAITALASLAKALFDFTKLFRALRAEIFERLEKATADSGADKKRKNMPKVPQNLEIVRLAQIIGRNKEPGETQLSIALRFTKGDRKKADSLLRQVRRHKLLPGKPRK